MPQQATHILASLAQRRQPQFDAAEPVAQGRAELPVEVGVGGRQHPRIYAACATARHLDLALLQGPQQLRLHGSVAGTDFIEEQGAVMGLLKVTHAIGFGTGEGASAYAKQFRGGQFFGDRRDVDRNQRLVTAIAASVDGARHQFLAGAGFAE